MQPPASPTLTPQTTARPHRRMLGHVFIAAGIATLSLATAVIISYAIYHWSGQASHYIAASPRGALIAGGALTFTLLCLAAAYLYARSEKDRRFQALFNSVTEAIGTFDPVTGRLIDFNTSGYRMFGFANRSEVEGKTIDSLSAGTAPYTATDAAGWIRRSFAEGPQTVTWHAKRKDGSLFWIEVNLRPVFFGAKPVILMSARDISDRMTAQSAQRESDERFRTIFTHVNDAVALIDLETDDFIDVNPRVSELFQYGSEELKKIGVAGLFSGAPPGYRLEDARAFLKRAQTGGPATVEWHCRAKDGRLFWLEISLRIASFRDRKVLLLVGRDITERKKNADDLAYHDYILKAVTVGTAAMVGAERLETGITTALGIVGRTMGVDRVLVLEMDENKSRPPSLRFDWQSPTVPLHLDQALLDAGGPIELAAQAEWLAPLYARKPVLTYLHDCSSAVRPILERVGNLSVMLVPIYVGDRLWGSIGIDHCTTARQWREAETETLQTFADLIGVLIVRDRARESLEKSEERFRAVTETALEAIVLADAQGRIEYWNSAATQMLGYTAQEARGKELRALLLSEPGAEPRILPSGTERILPKTGELSIRRKDGTEIPMDVSVSGFTLGDQHYSVSMMRDISDRRRAEAQFYHLERNDPLTGLPNRKVFVEALGQAIARSRREGTKFAVLYLDLDHFKDINDTLGHPTGDALLKIVADRFKGYLRETDMIARFGGDEFAVIQADVHDLTDAAVLAEKLLASAAAPIALNGTELRTGTSVGIAVYGSDSPDAEAILSQADVALYRAKMEGRGIYRFFTEAMDSDVRTRVTLASELRKAIVNGQLFLLYQPQVDGPTGNLVGVEALVRWQHPTRGLLEADAFVGIAETGGLIVPLGRWVLRTACMQMKAWSDAGAAPPLVAVNISAHQLKQPRELEGDVQAILSQTGLVPSQLELELTESTLMQVSREHNEALGRLRKLGIRMAIDDFGTGYSSLDYLRRFPVDRIKIAQVFVQGLPQETSNGAIIRAAIGLARELGIEVMTEGVETEEQAKLIASWGSPQVQGYFFSKPLTPDQLLPILRRHKITLARSSPAT